MPPAKAPPQPVRLIRLALIVGVLMFGAVIVFIHGQPGWKPGTLPPGAGYAMLACAVAAVPIVLVMRPRVLRESDPQRRVSLLTAGWAVGEAPALFGAALFLITGQSQWYLIGLVAMAISFSLLRTRGLP